MRSVMDGFLTTLDATSATPLHTQIRRGIHAAVRCGAMGPGDRLPAVRPLAGRLGVNRLTVLKAIRQLVKAGVLESVEGKGVFVARQAPVAAGGGCEAAYKGPFFEGLAEGPHTHPAAPPVDAAAARSVFQSAVGDGTAEELIAFSAGFPPLDAIPTALIRKGLGRLLRHEDAARHLNYAETDGYGPLLEALKANLAQRGLPLGDDDQLLITSGAQQGLALCLDVFVRGAGALAIESPGYMGMIAACQMRGIPMVPVPVDRGGINPARLETVLKQHHIAAIYTVPTYQNPTGVTQSRRRRERIVELARRYDTRIIEDDTYVDMRLGGRTIPPLKAQPGGERVVYVGSFSKSLAPGLRIGYAVASGQLAADLRHFKESVDVSSGSLSQVLLADLLASGQYTRHLARCRRLYRARRDAMLASLEKHFPPEVRYTSPKGGLHLWAMIERPVDIQSLSHRCRRRGVTFAPGSYFFVDGRQAGSMRLNFAMQTPQVAEEGIRLLATCMREEFET